MARREITFTRVGIDLYKVSEWQSDPEQPPYVRFMTADQAGKREGELIREGFRLYTETRSHRDRHYIKD